MPENPRLTPAKIAELPKFSKFIQAAKPGELKDMRLQEAVLEPKLDGHRMLAYVGPHGKVTLLNRNGIDKSKLLPHICQELCVLPEGTWLDGEAVGEGDTWNIVQSVLGADTHRPELAEQISYVIFDMIAFDGKDMRKLPLRERRGFGILACNDLLDGGSGFGYCTWNPQYPVTQVIFEQLSAQYEGAIVKDLRAPYASGKRGYGWFKLKNVHTIDVVVMGTKEGKGKFTGLIGALVFGQYVINHGGALLVERGACSGMTDAQREEFTAMAAEGLLNGTVLEIEHYGADLSTTGHVRHPQFKRVRDDKNPLDCVWSDK